MNVLAVRKQRFWLVWTVYVLAVMPFLGMIGFCWYLVKMSRLAIYEHNFDIFHNILSQAQGQAVLDVAQRLVALPVLLLTLTNVAWILASAVAIYRWQTRVSGHRHRRS